MSGVFRREVRGRAISARPSFARLALTFVALFAFTIQSFLVQTHIHTPPPLTGVGVLDFALAGKAGVTKTPIDNPANAPRDKYPPGEDPANCPLCQEFMHAGQYLAPAAVALVLPMAVALGPVIFVAGVMRTQTVSHNWQGRAPPSL